VPDVPLLQPLVAADADLAQRALACVAQGDAASAQNLLMQVTPSAASHPDILFVAATILEAQARPAEARRAIEGALQQAPGLWQLWNGYAALLGRMNEHPAAIAAYKQGLARSPRNPELLRNLALTQLEAGALDEAQAALDQAEAAEPGTLTVLHIGTAIAEARGDKAAAERSYRAILSREPADRAAMINLASALRRTDRAADALDLIERAGEDSVALTIKAHCFADLGQPHAAAEGYRQAIAANPAFLEPHETLARLLPQLGQGNAALASYDDAMARFPQSRSLHDSAILAARDVKDAGRMRHWAEAAITRFGPDPAFGIAQALAFEMSGERSAAIDTLRAVTGAHPYLAGAHNHLAPLLLAVGDLDAAETHASAGARLAPLDQSGWAWLTIIWRMKGDPREEWLADYDRLVMPMRLTLPDGIADALTSLHTTSLHPAEQSLRGGTQTRGSLFDKRTPEIRLLRDAISDAVRAAVSALPDDGSHPFLSRKTSDIAFAGSWSVRLRAEGFHIDHIHHQGWLSSACYIALPPVGGADHAGCLQFGVPDATLGLDLTPRRIVTPEEGMLVLFPSYFWHGTIPFVSDTPRLTVAFDAIPSR
jgi:tetratricopeptide (TPR) repeat protein